MYLESQKQKETEKKKKAELVTKAPTPFKQINHLKYYIGSIQRSFKNIIAIPSFRNNPERMQALRRKFIETALDCIGIPYGRKYLIEHPDYDLDLFLDCCGLVRFVLNELKEDFGFQLSKWNQAYQFDILPDPISFDQLKPGDLIFYTGINYPDRNRKKQTHDMVHVEIFLGDSDHPERTIGSRDSTGTVDLFETYQFKSENYYNIKYYFKSIDTWLRGIHRSFCKEHRWHEFNCNNKPPKYPFYYYNSQLTQAGDQTQNKYPKQSSANQNYMHQRTKSTQKPLFNDYKL